MIAIKGIDVAKWIADHPDKYYQRCVVEMGYSPQQYMQYVQEAQEWAATGSPPATVVARVEPIARPELPAEVASEVSFPGSAGIITFWKGALIVGAILLGIILIKRRGAK